MPESPELVVPDFIINWPLVPTFPAFEEIIDILPLLLDILSPLFTSMIPPFRLLDSLAHPALAIKVEDC
jgi:hypothetical protein